jgi:secondary thiamine-phosphate synthase enzyme
MSVSTDFIQVKTNGKRSVVDLTPMVREIVAAKDIQTGIAIAFIPGSTAAITTIEYEPGLVKDIDLFFERLLPYEAYYHHHETWHDDNGAAHLQAAVVGPSLTVPIVGGELALGTWQQVVLIDFDTRPRKREIIVQILA